MASKLDKKISGAMNRIQGLALSPEMRAAYEQSQALSRQGMDAASRQLAIQEIGRGVSAGLGALRGKRSLLAGVPGLFASSNDSALRLAAQDAMLRRENAMAGIQTGMQFGQAQTELERYKAEQQYNELAAKKARRAQMLSGIISAVGGIAGAAMTGGAAGGGSFLGGLFKSAAGGAAQGLGSAAASSFVAPKLPRLPSGNMMPGGLYSSGNN
jgi:hypothetical protein